NQIIQNFSDTWRICLISQVKNAQANFHLNVDFTQNLNQKALEEIVNKVKNFQKHYECIIYLPNTSIPTQDNINSEDIFDQYQLQKQINMNPCLLTANLANKYLTSNGVIMFMGNQSSFTQPLYDKIAFSLIQNQVNFLNLSMGDRETIDIDSFSLNLLQNDIEQEDNDQQNQYKQITQFIRRWAEGKSRPISGTFIKFNKKKNQYYPELI
ncbi:hypothetical protein IMG5_016970, partial [Ichthyophthirius multifiliis]